MNTHKTVHKWIWVWDFEKEERWLNEMAEEGWVLESVGFCTYHFAACEPGEYTIGMEMHACDHDYINFVKDTGAEYIGRVSKWIYFRKKTIQGDFNIFSDIDSRINHLDNIGKMLFTLGMTNLCIGLANSFLTTLSIGWINLLMCAFLMYALGHIHEKKEILKRNRLLHE